MVITKINVDELKLAETDITRSVYAMLPPELKDIVKDNAPKLYQPPLITRVDVKIIEIIGVSEISHDPIFCNKYNVSGFCRIWFKNGLSWYIAEPDEHTYNALKAY